MPEVVERTETCEWCGESVGPENLQAYQPLGKRGLVMCPNCLPNEPHGPEQNAVKTGPKP